MYLLPKEHPATKKILESPTNIPCDIYAENGGESVKQQIDDFMKFVESHLNKVRKSHIQRSTTRVSLLQIVQIKKAFYFLLFSLPTLFGPYICYSTIGNQYYLDFIQKQLISRILDIDKQFAQQWFQIECLA